MIKRGNRNRLFDKMHRGVVIACMGLTLYGSYLLGMRFYTYFTITKPSREAIETEMVKEGSADRAPLLKT